MEKEKSTYKLPEGWEIDTLGNIAFVNMGQSPPSISYNTKAEGLPFYQGKTEFGEMYPKVRKYCTEPIKIVDNNDVLISVRAPIGPTNLVKEKSCIVRGLAGIKAFGGMTGEFIIYQLRTLEKELQEKGTGTTFKSISKSILKNTPFKIPPLKEQHRIVYKIEELFSELDNAEEGLKKAQKQLEVYRQALLKSTFEGTLTRKWRGENLLTVSNHLNESDNNLPVSWRLAKIGDVSEFVGSGSTPRGGRNVYRNQGIPFIRSQNIQANSFLQDDLVFISKEINQKMVRTQTKPKDILLNITGASIGRCSYIPETFFEGNVNQHVCIIRLNAENVNYKYLTFYLNSPRAQLLIKRINSGATREALTLSQIKNMEFPLCNYEEQLHISLELESRFTLIENIEKSINSSFQNIYALKHTILKRAFEGKLVPQDLSDESASVLLRRLTQEKELYIKEQDLIKRTSVSKQRKTKMKEPLIEILTKNYQDKEFTFNDIRKVCAKPYDELKAEIYKLLDEDKELKMFFNKKTEILFYKIKS